ncbi:MAG TPA: (Fe-S)-binding protein [Myxococcales bacterium]|nr:(Fe-S)-binding protein [Myxococcales bacterium]
MDVALFVPCYVDQFYPRVGLAAAEVLERHGARVVFPEDQTCCGQPMANAGSLEDARPLAEKFLRVFGGHRYVVCPSGSCTSMVRNHYGPLLGERAREMQGKVFELCEFLHDVLQVRPRGRFPARVGLHQSCHGLRELRLGTGSERILPERDKVRELLSGIDGLELVRLERPDECCGFGGAFSIDEEAVSCRMGRDRVQDHERAGAEVITAGDMSCLMHLQGLIRRDRKPLRILHLAELLAEAEARP